MHVECMNEYRTDKCGCYFPGQCGNSFGYSRSYNTCANGGRLICQGVDRAVGMEGECIYEINLSKLLSIAGGWVQTIPPCFTTIKNVINKKQVSKTDWAICSGGIAQAFANTQLCGEVVSCKTGNLKPLIANEVYYTELGNDCPGGGRYPCDPF